MLVHIVEACESRVLGDCLTHCSDYTAGHTCGSYVLCLQHSLNTLYLNVNADLTIHDMQCKTHFRQRCRCISCCITIARELKQRSITNGHSSPVSYKACMGHVFEKSLQSSLLTCSIPSEYMSFSSASRCSLMSLQQFSSILQALASPGS